MSERRNKKVRNRENMTKEINPKKEENEEGKEGKTRHDECGEKENEIKVKKRKHKKNFKNER